MSDSRHTLLLVDDEPEVLDLLQRMFIKRYHVFKASSGPNALAILRRQRVDVLITDQRMPEMTGVELVAAARAEGIDFTALLLTGYTDPEDIIAAINRGQVYRYITKPWDLNDLFITVKNAVEFTQLRRDKERLLRQLHQRVEALGVLYEVSRASAGEPLDYDVIIDRVLMAVARVLPYDCGAALIALGPERTANLRLRCQGTSVGDEALLGVKESMLGAWSARSGTSLSEDRVITHVEGSPAPPSTPPHSSPNVWGSQLTVSLTAEGRPVGLLSLFSQRPQVYSEEDGALLDTLANQTVGAIQSLRASEEAARQRIERMVHSMADGVLLTDEKNKIVVLNPAARRLLRLDEDEGAGTGADTGAGTEEMEDAGARLRDKLGFDPFELVHGWEAGSAQVLREELTLDARTIHTTVTPVHDARGVLRGMCVVLRDVTEQKQLEERKDEFVHMVSHELRTPLTSISGSLDLVLDFLTTDMNEKQRRYLMLARDSTEKLNVIVDDLLDLAKFAKGRLRMNLEWTPVDELVRRAVERYGPAFLGRRISLSTGLPQHGQRAQVDPNRIAQVLNNLLTNAAKFTPEGGQVRLELRSTSALPGYFALSCWNSGEPIAEDSLERIFNRFEQARTQANRTVRGTGLGLAICRNIVEAHGGHIWSEPCPDGVLFIVVLPLEPHVESVRAEGSGDGSRKPETPSRGQLMLVEAEPDIGYIAKALLRARGYAVRLVPNAEQALALTVAHPPDALLVDARLPVIDGLRFAELVRQEPRTRALPLLLFSAFDERPRAFRSGADAFLSMPLSAESLGATVDSLMRGRIGKSQGRVLLADSDEKTTALCQEVLGGLGYEVRVASSLERAHRALRESSPDVLLLALQLPDGDGYQFLEEIKTERASGAISVIFLAPSIDTGIKVRALKLGANDVLARPFDGPTLGGRVEAVLRRKQRERGASPTTQLPGPDAIEREVRRRFAAGEAFAYCYLDLEHLRAYQDYYGVAKADGVLRQTGDLLREVLAREGLSGDFLGHMTGDDFVFVTAAERVDGVCQRALEVFDRLIPLYYDKQDRERGYIENEGRDGDKRRCPIMSMSVVAVLSAEVSPPEPAELARRAADLKRRARLLSGSVYLRSDRERAFVRTSVG